MVEFVYTYSFVYQPRPGIIAFLRPSVICFEMWQKYVIP